jgi:hypothetical protein
MSNQSHNGRPSLFDIATTNVVLPIFEQFRVQSHILEGKNFFPEAKIMRLLHNEPSDHVPESSLTGEIRMPEQEWMGLELEKLNSEGHFLFERNAFHLLHADDKEEDGDDWDEEEDEDWEEDDEEWEEDEEDEDWDEEDEDWDEDEDEDEEWEEEEESE